VVLGYAGIGTRAAADTRKTLAPTGNLRVAFLSTGPIYARKDATTGVHHLRAPKLCLLARNPLELPPPAVAPGLLSLIPPASITKMGDNLAMRATAPIAPGLCSLEPDDGRELAPVDGVEPGKLRADRHRMIIVDVLLGCVPISAATAEPPFSAVAAG
jgi:hypothetical protein